MSIDELTASQRAAWDRGQARVRAAMAASASPTTTSVALDTGAGGRTHIGWCLVCQGPYPQRCTCRTVDPLAVIEHVDDALDNVADVIAATRQDLDRFTDAADAIGMAL